jgi:hypothetical protein
MVRYTHLKGVYFFLVVWGVINPGYRQVAVRVLCPQILVGPGAFRTFSIFSALSFCSLGRRTKKKKEKLLYSRLVAVAAAMLRLLMPLCYKKQFKI